MEKPPKYIAPATIEIPDRTWPDKTITRTPVWASVDLRDGNQALPIPMNPQQKLEYFQMLCDIGFKEIEVGFPAASEDDFDFVRMLIDENRIPSGVRIGVLTPARPELIRKTILSLRGLKEKAIVNCYLAISDLHSSFVFEHDRQQTLALAVSGTAMIRKVLTANHLADQVGFEFSTEEFTDSDLDFAVELCSRVKETWGSSTPENFILNLAATVERRPPNHYADMIELFCRKYPYMKETCISLHAHNDQGCVVAATELALLAGATRVEGSIFGHGERTGNMDISILALNLESRGVPTGLCFKNMPELVRIVERNTGMEVPPRYPYAGVLAFTAFAGSHQDAIRKGLEKKQTINRHFNQGWKIPYLHIDPADVGREYEKLIRINSQSGKGGVVYILEHEFNIRPPKSMHPEIGFAVQRHLEHTGGEVDAATLKEIFYQNFVNVRGKYKIENYHRTAAEGNEVESSFIWYINSSRLELSARGNGPVSAMVRALKSSGLMPFFKMEDFSERSLGTDADAKVLAFVGLRCKTNSSKLVYGAGEDTNMDKAAIMAMVSALNRAANLGAWDTNDNE